MAVTLNSKKRVPVHFDGARAVRMFCVRGIYIQPMVPAKGFEPLTCGLRVRSSTTELSGHIEARHFHNNYKQLSILQIGQSAYSLVRLSEDVCAGLLRLLQLLLPRRCILYPTTEQRPITSHCNYYGGAERIRTADLFLTKEVHYHCATEP